MKPQDLFPDGLEGLVMNGQYVRKGSVGSFIHNVMVMEKTNPDSSEYKEALTDIAEILPNLKHLNVFEVFTVKSESLKKILLEINPDLPL
ncbi:hypothetical protein [Risungbinella massiliensis]|uniref:hypothetical protein n=1 Tax=Risungbinella massiliensis TaxID=1329796 RepID=UPI0005CB8046|nr:hypothetical protein [Risungbinella massiliensis]